MTGVQTCALPILVTNNLTLDKTLYVQLGTLNSSAVNLTVGGDIIIGTATTAGHLAAGNSTVTLTSGNRGLFIQSASSTFTSTGTLASTASSNTTWLYSITGSLSFYNISHTGMGTLQLYNSDATVAGTLDNTAGIFDANGYTATITGLTTISGGTYYAKTATQTFNGGLKIGRASRRERE